MRDQSKPQFDSGIQVKRPYFQSSCGAAWNGDSTATPICSPPTDYDRDVAMGLKERDEIESFDSFVDAGETLNTILRFLAGGSELRSIGLRTVALVSLLRPELFKDCNGSQQSIANRFGVQRAAVQKYTAMVRGLTRSPWRGHNQRSEAIGQGRRIAAIEQHKKAGHNVCQ